MMQTIFHRKVYLGWHKIYICFITTFSSLATEQNLFRVTGDTDFFVRVFYRQFSQFRAMIWKKSFVFYELYFYRLSFAIWKSSFFRSKRELFGKISYGKSKILLLNVSLKNHYIFTQQKMYNATFTIQLYTTMKYVNYTHCGISWIVNIVCVQFFFLLSVVRVLNISSFILCLNCVIFIHNLTR